MTCTVGPFVLARPFDNPRNMGFFSIYIRESSEAVNVLTNVVQFRAYGKDFVLASGVGLTDSDEMFPFSGRIRLIGRSGCDVARDANVLFNVYIWPH